MTAVGLFKELLLYKGCRLGDSRDRLLLNDVMFMFWGHTGFTGLEVFSRSHDPPGDNGACTSAHSITVIFQQRDKSEQSQGFFHLCAE